MKTEEEDRFNNIKRDIKKRSRPNKKTFLNKNNTITNYFKKKIMKKGSKGYKKPKKTRRDKFAKLNTIKKSEDMRRNKVCITFNLFIHYLVLLLGIRIQ